MTGEVAAGRWADRLAGRRFEMLTIAGLLAFIAATNRWMSFTAGYNLLQAHDEADFHAIAVAAPHLPSGKLQEQHAQRFAFHYVIGLVAKGLSANVDVVYTVAALLTAIGVCVLLAVVLVRIGVSRPVFAVCMGVFVLNTYSLRYYGLAPGEIADLLFDAGVLISILGCLERRFWLVALGVVWGTLARQSEVPVAFALAGWVALAPGWRSAALRVRALRAGGLLVLTGGVYAALVAIADPFSAHTTPGFSHFTMLWDLEHLGTDTGLGQHFVRSANGLLSVGALLIVALVVLWRVARPPSSERAASPARRCALPAGFWGCLAVATAIVAQPVAFSPQYAAHNETRLAVLGLGALVCALAFALQALEARGTIVLTPSIAALLIAVMAVGSFHHLYTWIGTANANQTVALQLVAAICLAGVMLRTYLSGRRTPNAAG